MTTDRPVDLTGFTALIANAWDWDLDDFCEALGLLPDAHGKQLFLDFQAVAGLLRRFDADSLRRVATRRPP